MATAKELLAAAAASTESVTEEPTEEILVADLDTRVISIPTTLQVLGVESDDDVKRLKFRVPRFYGEFDLSEFKVNINFENARGVGDFWPVDDLAVYNFNSITFSWLVDRTAFARAGDVTFNICMKKYDADGVVVKELNTTTATLPVLPGLETSKEVVENNPSAFDAVLFRLYAVEAATGNGQNGYYSLVKVDQSDYGALFTIVNQDGESVAVVKHGTDGYTPVKGVDYWTDSDKNSIYNDVKTYVNNWLPKQVLVTLDASMWSNNSQTIAIDGIDPINSVILISPETSDENYTAFVDAEIRCVSQDTNSVTFQCESVPSVNIAVNVVVYFARNIAHDSANFTVTDDGNGNVIIM